MSQTYANMLAKVKEFHDKHEFSKKENNGHDMAYRILLTIEELGELAECFTKGKPQSEKAEELADILEVIYRIAQLKGISKEELEKIRIKKLQDRGGFEKNLFLIDTSEE